MVLTVLYVDLIMIYHKICFGVVFFTVKIVITNLIKTAFTLFFNKHKCLCCITDNLTVSL